MNIYKIYADGLATYTKNKEQIVNLEKSSTKDGNLVIGKYL